MTIQAQAIASEKSFDASRAQFEKLVGRLSSKTSQSMTHSELEALVEREGREVLRLLVQDHLDLRSAREEEEHLTAVVGEDGLERNHRRAGTHRLLTTQFGDVEVRRVGYSTRGASSRFPLDAELNLPDEQYSLPLRRRVAEWAAQVSFDAVGENVRSSTGAELAKRQIEELAQRAARDFDDFYAQRVASPATSTAGILALSTDGKGVVMRREDLREATRKKAETRNPKLRHRLTRGEKSHRKRMATVAAVWTVAPWVRTVEDIVHELRRDDAQAPAKRPRPEHKRTWASIEKDLPAVVEEAFQDALRRDPHRTKEWVALVDGNEPQLNAILEAAARHGVDVRIIVDLIHVLEYLWKAACALNPEGSPEAEQWVTDHLVMLLQGKVTDVAAGIRRSATRRNLPPADRAPIDDCADYLLKYRPYLYYDVYLAHGLPIATGVIEGACRHLIKDRMDLTGARWSLQGAEAVLRLRALRTGGDFDAYWDFHERQELARNHARRYAQGDIPARPSVRRARLRLLTTDAPSLSS